MTSEAQSVHPLGDYVLVKPIGDGLLNSRFILIPGAVLDESLELRKGLVIACGPGDKTYIFACVRCGKEFLRLGTPPEWQDRVDRIDSPEECDECRGIEFRFVRTGRAPMYTKPGDQVIFGRAGDVELDGEQYHIVHEEQHIWAVLDKEES
jgi:co-chaperonin GroES (HSP10)